MHYTKGEKTMIHDEEFGRIEISTIPFPVEPPDITGTYTSSGRVLIGYRTEEDSKQGKDYYHVVTLNDDGTDLREVYAGMIPQHPTANGIRWMCYTDNKRVLLGDYVLEATPSLDNPQSARLMPVIYPQTLMNYPGLFKHWSEPIISPDCEMIGWTMLTFTGAANFIGKLAEKHDKYVIEDVYCISTKEMFIPDGNNEGYVIPQVLRGGEIKQFINGGRAISLVGNSDSISDSVIEALDTGNIVKFSNTPGYEETAIFSPDEKLAICMSPRFSPTTDCAIIGCVPLPHSGYVRMGIINPAYNYAIASQRNFRMGNIGPALVSTEKTLREGRVYLGVNLSDKENRYVYYSPMSWSPCSTKALWNEHTRLVDKEQKGRVRIVKLLDREPSAPVDTASTPKGSEIPYAISLEEFLQPATEISVPYSIKGKGAGKMVCQFNDKSGYRELHYQEYSDDGKTFYNGVIASKCPASMFDVGKNIFCGDLAVTGEHHGELRARIVFTQKSHSEPVMLSFADWDDGKPASYGYASFDGETVFAKDMMQ